MSNPCGRTRIYSDQERMDALRHYLTLGSYSKAEEASGIPQETMKSWKHSDREWWDRACSELIIELEGNYRPGWLRVLGKAIEAIEDRLDKGDVKLLRDGSQVRVEVPAKEAAIIAGIARDKLGQFLKKPLGPVEDVEKRRKDLAEIARKDREASKKDAVLAQMPVNRPVVQSETVAN